MSTFDAILFDLGGVIVDLDWAATNRAFRALVPEQHGARADAVLADIFQHPALHTYERGEIPWDSFREHLTHDTGLEATEAQFLAAWNSMLGAVPRARIDRLGELKGRYRLGFLSNTNERHVDFVNSYLQDTHGVSDLDSLVHVPLYSHRVGMRKPEARIYHHAAKALGVEPSRILFIDDMKMNANAANEAGLYGYHLNLERESVLDVLQRLA